MKRKIRPIAKSVLLPLTIFFCLPLACQSKILNPFSKTPIRSPVQSLLKNDLEQLVVPSETGGKLSFDAKNLAKALGVSDTLEILSRQENSRSDAEKLRVLIAKQELTETLLCQSFEVRSCLGKLDMEIAEADDLQAFLEERRDRAIRLNTVANFISGGITGIVGGSLDVSQVTEKGAGSIDLGEGITQTAIALLALKEQQGERRLMEGMPSMLARLFDNENVGTSYSKVRDYPVTIWNFLNSSSGGSNLTRREILINHWNDLKITGRHKVFKAVQDGKIKHLLGTHPRTVVTIDLLDARSAMLHDVRAIISQMDQYLLELMQHVRSIKL
jgi:hypothetical protein